ncbi:MAG: Fic family protein [Campylobacteraceae bacterium]|jgi:cell filamentation protein|nr:Fic family protein [Campylobacteraceae bacterium]
MDEFTKKWLESNLLGAKTIEELHVLERRATRINANYLMDNPIKGNFDYKHLKNIHKALFENVYTFAGQDRFDMGIYDSFGKKSLQGDMVWFISGLELPKHAERLFDELKAKNNLKGLNYSQFAKEGVSFFIELNKLHPFREGNGRTQRIFMCQLAKEAGYELNLAKGITKNEMTNACINGMRCGRMSMIRIFSRNLKPLEFEKTKPIEKNFGRER